MTDKKKAASVLTAEEKAARLDAIERARVPLPPAPADRIRLVRWEGQEYSVDPTVLDDVVVLELLADMDEKPFLLAKFIRHLLGDEPRKDQDGSELPSQWEAFKENHKDERGRLTVTRLGEFMTVLNKELEALGN